MIETILIIIRDILPWLSIYFIISISLNIEYGYLGLPNFGKVLTVAGGAFVAGSFPGLLLYYILKVYETGLDYYDNNSRVIYTYINPALKSDPILSIGVLFLTLFIAVLIGIALGFISSYPALRLREDYLGMTLLAMGEIITAIGINYKYPVGGTIGVSVPNFFIWIDDSSLRQWARIGLLSAFAVVIYIIVHKFVNSPLGRVLRAIRDNEILAQTFGKDIVKYRRNVLMFAGAISSLAGALLTIYFSSIVPTAYTRYSYTFIPWVMVIVGGLANNLGCFLGVSTFIVTLRLTDIYKRNIEAYLPFDVVWFTPLVLSIILTLMLIFRPEGLIKEKPIKTLTEKEISYILSKLNKK